MWCVALFVSAWIEISGLRRNKGNCVGRTLCECVDWNHTISAACLSIIGRTLCECVDWNIHVNVKVWSAIKSHSLWVRGLKFIKPVVRRINNLVALLVSAWIEIRLLNHNRYGQRGRTPCECVDWNNKYDAMYYNDLSRTPCECVDWNMCVLQRKQKD